MPRCPLSSLESVFFLNSNSVKCGWDEPTLDLSHADILMVPKAEMQYGNNNIICDGEHNDLLALDMTLAG